MDVNDSAVLRHMIGMRRMRWSDESGASAYACVEMASLPAGPQATSADWIDDGSERFDALQLLSCGGWGRVPAQRAPATSLE